MKKELKIPQFKNEEEEREFWWSIDLSEYYDPEDVEGVSFPNLKPTSSPISLEVPEYILTRVRERANSLNIPYESLLTQYIAQGALKQNVL